MKPGEKVNLIFLHDDCDHQASHIPMSREQIEDFCPGNCGEKQKKNKTNFSVSCTPGNSKCELEIN